MPPKAKPNAPSKKNELKKKEKIIEDKTFGLKNKKGAKQQKFISQVQKQVKDGGNKSFKDSEKEKENLKKTKEDRKKALAEINSIFKPVQQMAAKGVDPKSVLCAYFKEGQCSKGTKCKFSHDLNVERKGEKRSAYEEEEEQEQEAKDQLGGMSLDELIEAKHGAEKNKPNPTKIICKAFLEAVENNQYGWFWNCPNGEKCVFRHALPQGYILKKDKKKMDKDKEVISIEDLVERQRAALGHDTTKVTLVTFLAWKKGKLKERAAKEEKDTDKKKRDYTSGKSVSGKDMFTFNPQMEVGTDELEEDDDAEFDLKNMEKDEDQENEDDRFQFKEIDMNELMADYKEVDTIGVSVAPENRFTAVKEELQRKNHINNDKSAENGVDDQEGAVAIDEALFDDDDLDNLEEELDELDIS